MLAWRIPILIFICLLVAKTARAKDADVEAKERAARTNCLSGDYAKGAAILSELFVATKDPAFIYNQGRCFEQNSRYEDAIARFQEYLRVGRRLSRAEKADAEKHIVGCQTLLAERADSGTGRRGESKEARERAARKACLSGNVDKGSEILSDLYLDYKDPTHIYNLGRCYEQNHRYEDAVSRFREYLLKARDLTEADRSETDKHIATCLAYLGKSEPTPTLEAPPTAQPRPPSPSSEPTEPRAISGEASAAPVAELSAASGQNRSSLTSAPGNHSRQPGLFLHFERVFVPGISYGIAGGLEIEAAALIGYYKGTWLGLRYLFLNGAVKPGLGLAVPLFVVDGKPIAGVECSAIVQWDLTRHVGFYGSIGLSYFPRAASDLGALWFLPGIGAQVRL
jgi:tetratricopeptide (TPR) repeat protein